MDTGDALARPQSNAPMVGTPAVWRSGDADIPVRVIGDGGVGPDGRRYVKATSEALGGEGFVPVDELIGRDHLPQIAEFGQEIPEKFPKISESGQRRPETGGDVGKGPEYARRTETQPETAPEAPSALLAQSDALRRCASTDRAPVRLRARDGRRNGYPAHRPNEQTRVSYEGVAREAERRICRASSKPELREALLAGLEVHRTRGRLSFLRLHRRAVYRALLTRGERAFVREEVRSWIRSRDLFFGSERESEDDAALNEVRAWSRHEDPLHFPHKDCEWCQALVLDIALRRRSWPRLLEAESTDSRATRLHLVSFQEGKQVPA